MVIIGDNGNIQLFNHLTRDIDHSLWLQIVPIRSKPWKIARIMECYATH